MLVVSHHAIGSWEERIATPVYGKITWLNGASGVDIFFVISGFVMAITAPGLAGRAHKGWEFLRRRFIRLIPLYWIFTTIKLLRLELGPPVAGQTAGSLRHVVASYLFIPSLNNLNQPFPLVAVGWTLNFEMFFYLLFALALALDFQPLAFLLPTMVAVALASGFDHASWPIWTVVVSPLVLEFLAGIVLAHFTMQRRLPTRWVSIWLLVGGFAAILTLPLSGGALRLLCWGVPALAIVTGAVGLEDVYGRRLPKWLLEVGNASYAIYLVHLFVVGAVWVVLLRLRQSGYLALVEMIVVSLVLSSVVGEVVHRLIELPLIRLFRHKRVPGVNTLPA